VQQLVGADGTRLGADLISEELHHRLRELTAVHDAGWSPDAKLSNRSTLSPPTHDDDEVTPTGDRATIVARDSDAPSALRLGDDLPDPVAEILGEARELVAVAQRTKSIHDPVTTVVEAARVQERDERANCFNRG